MSIKVLGYAASQAKAKLEPFHFQRRDPRPDDIVIEILYCGICHSDLHQVNNDWNRSIYPMVPGHEIIGRVLSIGKKVTRFKADDLVGVGCMVDSCRHCKGCEQGLEQYCQQGPTFTYNSVDPQDQLPTFGGYSEKIVVTEKFVLKIPDGLDLKATAPLLCAGITTWSPLRHWQVGKNSKVAVIGLGGLGHMALKLAKALGAHVSLFSRSPGKEEDAHRLGADRVIISSNPKEMAKVDGEFELILDTVPYPHDINAYMPSLSFNGTLVLVGFIGPLEPTLNAQFMILQRKSLAGSLIGGIVETQEMLDFCGKHGITADVELIKIQDIHQSYERMLKSDVKYRFVIDMASLKKENK